METSPRLSRSLRSLLSCLLWFAVLGSLGCLLRFAETLTLASLASLVSFVVCCSRFPRSSYALRNFINKKVPPFSQ